MPAPVLYFAALLLLLLLLWLAWQRPDRRHLTGRLLATSLAVAALTFLAQPPSTKSLIRTGEAILLTPGFNADKLRVLRRHLPNQLSIFRLEGVRAAYPVVSGPGELKQRLPGLTRLHVLGFGLSPELLSSLDSLPVVPHLTPPGAGVIAIHWPEKLALGQHLIVSGRYHNPGKAASRLYLKVADRAVDSLLIQGQGIRRFSLRYLPKQEGKFVYTVAGGNRPEIAELGPVPVQVNVPEKWRALLLPASPHVEFNFLKNYLANRQHGVAWRIPVSKDLFQTEFINLPSLPLDRLTPAMLRRFDVLITEPAVLQHLTGSESQALTNAIEQEGLGLLVLADVPLAAPRSKLLAGFNLVRSNPKLPSRSQVFWKEQEKPMATPLPEVMLQPVAEASRQAWSSQGILAASRQRGWGSIAVSTLTQTYSWQLAGHTTQYAAYWSQLLGSLVKTTQPDHTWLLPDPLSARSQAPVILQLTDFSHTAAAPVPSGQVYAATKDPVPLALQQDVMLPYKFTGTFWPGSVGWHRVKKENGTDHFFYIYTDTAWTGVANYQLYTTTKAYLQQRDENRKPVPPLVTKATPVQAIWFFLLFLASTGFLWLEEKW